MSRPKPPDGSAHVELERLLDQLEPLCERVPARSHEGHDHVRAADTQVLSDGLARIRQLRAALAQVPCDDPGPDQSAASTLKRILLAQAAAEVVRWILHRIETSICSFTAVLAVRFAGPRPQAYAGPVVAHVGV